MQLACRSNTKFALFVILSAPQLAHAYLGPGVGAGAIATVFGILASIILAFVGILWYPIKRLLKRRRNKPGHEDNP